MVSSPERRRQLPSILRSRLYDFETYFFLTKPVLFPENSYCWFTFSVRILWGWLGWRPNGRRSRSTPELGATLNQVTTTRDFVVKSLSKCCAIKLSNLFNRGRVYSDCIELILLLYIWCTCEYLFRWMHVICVGFSLKKSTYLTYLISSSVFRVSSLKNTFPPPSEVAFMSLKNAATDGTWTASRDTM